MYDAMNSIGSEKNDKNFERLYLRASRCRLVTREVVAILSFRLFFVCELTDTINSHLSVIFSIILLSEFLPCISDNFNGGLLKREKEGKHKE